MRRMRRVWWLIRLRFLRILLLTHEFVLSDGGCALLGAAMSYRYDRIAT
jgi:hypothetical protein